MSDLSERVQAVLGDSYRIERELPPGGMSRLFLATERSLDRQVVVKILPPELASEVSAARFQREVTLAAHLQHPHILPVLSAGSRDGILYYITQRWHSRARRTAQATGKQRSMRTPGSKTPGPTPILNSNPPSKKHAPHWPDSPVTSPSRPNHPGNWPVRCVQACGGECDIHR